MQRKIKVDSTDWSDNEYISSSDDSSNRNINYHIQPPHRKRPRIAIEITESKEERFISLISELSEFGNELQSNAIYRQQINSLKFELQRKNKEIKELKYEMKELKKRRRNFEFDEMTEEQITEMQSKLVTALERVHQQKNQESLCVICWENRKNVVFQDGCDHFVVCKECLGKTLQEKQCPICRQSFSKIKVVYY